MTEPPRPKPVILSEAKDPGNPAAPEPGSPSVAQAPDAAGPSVEGARAAQPAPPLPCEVQLERYEGPLDLLLDLIRQQQIDIHDIPIAKITGQYLEYLRGMEQHNIELSGDFLFMAATLIYIKSKMLLPAEPALPGEAVQEDPRELLVHQLIEHEKFRSAAQMLHERQQIEDHTWSKPDRSLYEGGESEAEIVVSLVDLVKVFQQVLERRQKRQDLEFERDEVTVTMMIARLREELSRADSVRLMEFFERCPTRRGMIAAFLAVLEMVRLGAVLVVQNETFAEILLRKHKMFDVVFSGEPGANPLGSLDRDYH